MKHKISTDFWNGSCETAWISLKAQVTQWIAMPKHRLNGKGKRACHRFCGNVWPSVLIISSHLNSIWLHAPTGKYCCWNPLEWSLECRSPHLLAFTKSLTFFPFVCMGYSGWEILAMRTLWSLTCIHECIFCAKFLQRNILLRKSDWLESVAAYGKVLPGCSN